MFSALSRSVPKISHSMKAAIKRTGVLAHQLRPAACASTWNVKGIDYRLLDKSFDPEIIFKFNKEFGSTPLNFIPDGPVREHLAKIATGETLVWAGFEGDKMVGFITGERGGGYWMETGPKENEVYFIHEFVVDPSMRGKSIGTTLTKMSIDGEAGVFGVVSDCKEMYTTVHSDNVASRTAFIKGGYHEVITYQDDMRDRATTVLKAPRP